MYPSNHPSKPRRLPELLLFISFIAWYFAARTLASSAADGLAFRFRLVASRQVLEACFHLFLLVIGFAVLESAARRHTPLRELAALPHRETRWREWLTGAGLGWAMIVGALMPLVLLGRVHTVLSPGWSEIQQAVLAVAVLLLATLAHEMAFRGYPFRCLIRAVGRVPAVALMVAGAGMVAWHNVWIPGAAVMGSMLLTLLLSICWLRTHAVWLSWGLHFGLVAVGSILFGMPVGMGESFSSLVRSVVVGPDWLSGGSFGPAGAVSSLVVLCLAIPVLYRLTREYAWHYTHAPIVAGGYEVTVAPPAAHAAMEQQSVRAPALVQILATTPTSFSATSSSAPIGPGDKQIDRS